MPIKGQPRAGSRLTRILHPNQAKSRMGFSQGWIKMWIAIRGLISPNLLSHTCARGSKRGWHTHKGGVGIS